MIFAILREDLGLPPGKAAAKLGQAMITAFNKATPEQQKRYLSDGEGTQVVLTVPDQESLLRTHAAATGYDFPTSIVIENGKLMAIGIGPVHREFVAPITKELKRMK